MLDALKHNGTIEPDELYNILECHRTPSPKILDASFVLPGSADDPKASFENQHIEGAQFFDIEAVCDHHSDLPHMLPTPEDFARHISNLGISNDDFVVVYGQSGMVMGPARAWWMFHVFGHDRVAVLDGGLPAWMAEGHRTCTGKPATPKPAVFTATLNPKLVVDRAQMEKAVHNKEIQIYDARPSQRFLGTAPEPREALQSGHIPSSHNIPASHLVCDENGCLKSREELEQMFMVDGWDYHKKTYATCGSGVTACMLALALYNLGATDVAVYDGSWSEWGLKSLNMPIEK